MKLRIMEGHVEKILKRATESKIEICGFLLGVFEGDTAVVKKVVFMKNRLNSPVAFEMEPEEMVKVLEWADENGLDVVGIFHSHLCEPLPSQKDFKGMRNWPVAWFIVDNKGNYGAFMLDENEEIEEVELILV
ncbi:hypothetical protein PAP_08315 [Palaeococcus pacificus DY20341]|uniref:JAB1/MPN/MOV34 metalloenzyme domain-containing protein n=1 Tax=Palaeococcus pacificus DY20341 TaxID=1343739 RepID=A0A075LV83_9EURY|nr:M67 family metallopeptidase [Palaeococcus pacificus]AIF70051.1 hypothetical protein PAP_08315 [Palaeococcus pacificus DY20341]